ncbi:MAG: DUF4288 domain-containing protein [Cyclobacteriaceae bacterium]
MNWYIAKIVFNIISGSGNHTPQFDEQYRLIKAESMEEAFDKAMRIGMGEEEMLLNSKNEIVRWEFVNIAELYPIDELRDGMELFSSIQEMPSRKDYIETIHLKAAYVQSKFQTEEEQVG